MAAPSVIERLVRHGGQRILHLHGVPGSVAEAQLIEPAAVAAGVVLLAIERPLRARHR